MADIQPYSLEDAQLLVDDGIHRSESRWRRWNALEEIFRTGQSSGYITAGNIHPRVWTEFPGLDLDTVNLALPYLELIIATAIDRLPRFLVEPYGGGDEAERKARLSESLLKYFWKRMDAQDMARRMVQDMVVLGAGFCKTGWLFEEAEVEKSDDELREALRQLHRAEQQEAILEDRSPKSKEDLFDLIETSTTKTISDEPFLEYVSPYDILLPPTARRLEEARWIAQRYTLPFDEVEANPQFEDEAKEELSLSLQEDYQALRYTTEEKMPRANAARSADPQTAGYSDPAEDPFAEVTLWEFYDMRTRTTKIFQEDSEAALYDGEFPHSHRHPPFVMMRGHEDGGVRIWPFGDLENIAGLQETVNDFNTEQMEHARRAGNKYVVDEDVWTEEFRDLIETGQSDAVAKLNLGDRQLADVFSAVERKPTPPEIFQGKADAQRHMGDVLGLHELQRGGTGPDRMAATTAAIIDEVASSRVAFKKEQVEAALSRAGLHIVLLCQEFLDAPKAIRITGSMGAVAWVDVDQRDISGEFGVSVESGSTQAVSDASRKREAIEIVTGIIPSIAADGYDTEPFWRKALQYYGMDPDRMLKRPKPTNMPGMATPPGQGPANPAGGGAEPGGSPVAGGGQGGPGTGAQQLAGLGELMGGNVQGAAGRPNQSQP